MYHHVHPIASKMKTTVGTKSNKMQLIIETIPMIYSIMIFAIFVMFEKDDQKYCAFAEIMHPVFVSFIVPLKLGG
jgi:hypothetical protein